jgi:hypothetical protein
VFQGAESGRNAGVPMTPLILTGDMVRAVHPKMRQWNESRRVFLDPDKVASLFAEGRTTKEISDTFGCSTTPVAKVLKQLGLRRPANRRPGMGYGPANSAWKGGRRIRRDGYVVLWTPNGERLEHQCVMEQCLGRALLPTEIVHHLDGNKQNNSIENLIVTTQSEHSRLHAAQRARRGL